jgi:hypothetical protein
VHAQQYEHSHSYKPQSRTCRSSICHFYLQCMIDLLQLIFSYKQLHQILILLSTFHCWLCVKASQEFLNNECPPLSAVPTGVLRHWSFYIVLNLQLLILNVKVLHESLNNEYCIVNDDINWSTASAMMRTVSWNVQESLEVWRITKTKI